VWQVVRVRSVEAEDQRHLHRDFETLKQEQASTTTPIQGLLSSQGIRLTSLSKLADHSRAPISLRSRDVVVEFMYTDNHGRMFPPRPPG
jgi:hypothetical protein